MAENKPEVNLEISSGFFRINALDAVYNITVPGNLTGSVTEVVERIVETERSMTDMPLTDMDEAETLAAETQVTEKPGEVDGDDYYKKVSSDLYNDIGNLAKSLSSTMTRIPMEDQRQKRASLDEAGEKIEDAKAQLKDIVNMTENATMEIMDSVESIQSQTDNVKELLSFLKNHTGFISTVETEGAEDGGETDADANGEESIAQLQAMLGNALELVGSLPIAGAEPPKEETFTAAKTVERYPFVIDVVIQTIYELCTNETVKGHLTNVRENIDAIFDYELFVTAMNEAVGELEPDSDNFLTLPLTVVLDALLKACTDKKITNLLKKMNSGQADIFLDGNLPIEAPAKEQAVVQEADEGGQPAGAEADPKVAELAEVIKKCQAVAENINASSLTGNGRSVMSRADQDEIFSKIEAAFGIATNICGDVAKINESLSFQDLSGQQILKIIKLLSDFQVQLLAIVVSFGSQLKRKEEKPDITAEESKRLAQDDVDSYINKINVPSDDEGKSSGLDQDAVNKMLAEMGF